MQQQSQLRGIGGKKEKRREQSQDMSTLGSYEKSKANWKLKVGK